MPVQVNLLMTQVYVSIYQQSAFDIQYFCYIRATVVTRIVHQYDITKDVMTVCSLIFVS